MACVLRNVGMQIAAKTARKSCLVSQKKYGSFDSQNNAMHAKKFLRWLKIDNNLELIVIASF